jgi:hypothetical protein
LFKSREPETTYTYADASDVRVNKRSIDELDLGSTKDAKVIILFDGIVSDAANCYINRNKRPWRRQRRQSKPRRTA